VDLSRQKNNGTLINGIEYNSSNTGNLVFDGANDIITVPMSNLRPTLGITQEVWMFVTINTAQVFIGAQYGSSSNNSYAIWLTSANTWAAGVNTGTFNSQTYVSAVITNTWYHFVHTYDGVNQIMYLNNNQIKSWSTAGNIIYDVNNTLLAVGNDWNGGGYNTGAAIGIRGGLSVARIYNRALTATEVQRNYEATRGRYGI
jgi:hypothetical protein